MNVEDVRLFYAYNRWANARAFEAAAALLADRFAAEPSVRDTLVHIVSAEWIWLRRWKGESPKAMFDAAEFPTLDSLKTKWAEIEREQAEFVRGVTDGALAEVVSYVNTKGETWRYPLVRMMQHLVNHSTYHRGQAMARLRRLGAEPLPTDFLVFLDERE